MRWRRRWDCGICGKPVIYDDADSSLECGCCKFIVKAPLPAFQLVTRFDAVSEVAAK